MKNKTILFCWILALALSAADLPLTYADDGPDKMRGVKIYEYTGDFNKLFREWKGLKINTAFVGEKLAENPVFFKTAKEHGIKTFIVFPVFCVPGTGPEDPSLYALNAGGQPARDEWVHFVCPTRSEYRRSQILKLKNIIRSINPDGISIDFIRFFVYWEKVFPGASLDPPTYTCFCDSCLKDMEDKLNLKFATTLSRAEKARWLIKNHHEKWVKWKCNIISSMVREISEAAKKVKPDILLNAHIIPWRQKDYHNGIRVIAGQDIQTISRYVNYLSPMCYWYMVKRDPSWIHEVVKDMASRVSIPVIPSIQVKESYLTEPLDLKTFREAYLQSLKAPSSGVVFWKWDFFNLDPVKKTVLK